MVAQCDKLAMLMSHGEDEAKIKMQGRSNGQYQDPGHSTEDPNKVSASAILISPLKRSASVQIHVHPSGSKICMMTKS